MRSSILSLFLILGCASAFGAIEILSDATHHLGVAGKPEWDIFVGRTPEAENLTIRFEAKKNPREYTLFIRQDDVKQEWPITLNGKKIGQLSSMEADLVHSIALPPESLRDGVNELIFATKVPEDILIHQVAIGNGTKSNLLTMGPVEFAVEDEESHERIPARITLQDANGSLPPIFDFGATNLATRPGVIYTGNGFAQVKLLAGSYTVYATRGPEYSVAKVTDFDPSKSSKLTLKLRRKADTRGWVAADTHIHTLALSRHGDAELRERMITIAGEGIELPISTEHNLHADYHPEAEKLDLLKYFTIVPGNEVTTKKGHFNVFPVDLTAKPIDSTLENWPDLFRQIHAMPQVRVIILNHPTDTHSSFTPFAATNLNVLTGRNLRGNFDFEFNAMELINSGAMRSQWMEPFRAWFALLNRGYKITGVGSSDSHDVSRFIVGQGRTYIRTDDSDVGRIDIQKACESLKQGHALISLGLIADMTIANADKSGKPAGPGDLISSKAEELELNIRITAPIATAKAARLTLCANGWPVEEFSIELSDSKASITKVIKRPRRDTHYVLIGEIQSDLAPFWGLARPYQPTSRHFRSTLIGATNPIWVDADDDGKFSSARRYAEELAARHAASPTELVRELGKYDRTVIWQCADVLNLSPETLSNYAQAGPYVKRGFKEYLEAQGLRGDIQPAP